MSDVSYLRYLIRGVYCPYGEEIYTVENQLADRADAIRRAKQCAAQDDRNVFVIDLLEEDKRKRLIYSSISH